MQGDDTNKEVRASPWRHARPCHGQAAVVGSEGRPLAGACGAWRASPCSGMRVLYFSAKSTQTFALEWAERVGSQLPTWPHGIGSPTPPISHTRTPTMLSAPIISSERSLLHALRCIRSNLKQPKQPMNRRGKTGPEKPAQRFTRRPGSCE
ncbi:uncharacterized protein PSANT_01133 [Moesziomyces antarcticus]|uniref:Uncharacterized protein n=1 Tax=Pseudozyma antarctica TaxID=84753 RepID=A0A5C3FGG1_PSEA2|nr:uncharacterized protein PSANT_01133 [Moesziomyces antarcticus]